MLAEIKGRQQNIIKEKVFYVQRMYVHNAFGLSVDLYIFIFEDATRSYDRIFRNQINSSNRVNPPTDVFIPIR